MAQTRWVLETLEAGKKDDAHKAGPGSKVACVTWNDEKEAADTDGSILKIARLPANAVPLKCDINNDAIVGLTDVDLGLYRENGDAADADLFLDGADLSGGKAIGSEQNGLATGPAIDKIGKRLWELLGKTVKNKDEDYVLALTLNTGGANTGTISGRFWYALPE